MLEFHRMGWFRFSGFRAAGHSSAHRGHHSNCASRSDFLALSRLLSPPRGVSVRCQRESAASPRAHLCVRAVFSQPLRKPCGPMRRVAAVRFELTPLRTGAFSQRLRPLGQTVVKSCTQLNMYFFFACESSHFSRIVGG